MKKKSHNRLQNNKGNALLVTMIIIIILTVIVGAMLNMSRIQFDLSMFQRNTSNTYYLAASAIEKQSEMINKAIQTELSNNIEKLSKSFFEKIILESDVEILALARSNAHTEYKNIEYASFPRGAVLKIKDDKLHDYIEAHIFDFIKDNFLKDNQTPGKDKQLSYVIESDAPADTKSTHITILCEAIYTTTPLGLPIHSKPIKNEFKMTAKAVSKSGMEVFDEQKVEAIITIHIPAVVDHEIREKYKWVGNPPEILDAAITCFSDMAVTSGGKLTVEGDIRVKGTQSPTVYSEADQSGGLIVSNGGELRVDHGNIYCINNVATTNGWTSPTEGWLYNTPSKITVTGDIIANTVGIYDDYYSGGANKSPFGEDAEVGNKVRNNSISVSKNIFADNDIKIDKWVGLSHIDVAGTLFGISDNNYGGAFLDPNLSSGVFNQGFQTSIKAHQMFIHGQAFIMFTPVGKPAKLWESIGEPFDGVSSWGVYAQEDTDAAYEKGDKSYLSSGSVFESRIKKDAIEIMSDQSYAQAYISAKINGTPVTQMLQNVINPANANNFFYQGGYTPDMTKFTIQDNGYGSSTKGYILQDGSTYYKGGNSGNWKHLGMYKKNYAEPEGNTSHFYKGIRRYMTAMRSVFYGTFVSGEPQLLEFEDVVDYALLSISPDTLSNQAATWSYNHPIYNIGKSGGTIEINQFYVQDDASQPEGTLRPYPSIIVNDSDNILTIETADPHRNVFRGIIISKGKVELKGNIIIEGSIIVGGTEVAAPDRASIMLGDTAGLRISGTSTVTIKQNPDVLLEVECGNHNDIRIIMDALKITEYTKYKTLLSSEQMAKILGPYNYPITDASDYLSYTLGHVVFKDTTRLDIKTDKLKVSIKNMKKIY